MAIGNQWSRRGFLRGLASTIALPTVVPRQVWAAGDAAPNERITMGFIGTGRQGLANLRYSIGHPDMQVVAGCDVRDPMREAFHEAVCKEYRQRPQYGESYRGPDLYKDFRELLARDDIDAVLIATPDHWHAVVSIEAAKAGKDIYCEKPMTLTIGEGRAMVNAVRRYGRVFQTGSQQRSGREFRFACEMVRSGRIGELKSVEVYVGGPSQDCYLPAEPEPDWADWNMWLGPAPWRPYHSAICAKDSPGAWRAFRDYSGGGMTDWGAHHFDIAQWGIGADGSGPIEVLLPEGEDRKWMTYRYANGVTMTHGGPGSYSVVEGKRGGNDGTVFNGTEGKIEVTRGYLRTWPEHLMLRPTGPDEVHLHESRGHHADFFRSVRTRQKPVCDVEVGCRSATVCHLGNLAYWLGRDLKWDPATERFVDDDEANRWVDRPKREPWTLG